jgi:hypothetical protein
MHNTKGYYVGSNPRGGFSAYDWADSIAAVKKALSRTRTRKYFIFAEDSSDLAKITCTCGTPLSEGEVGNRCTYYKGKIEGQHYSCAWGTTLTAISKIRTYN